MDKLNVTTTVATEVQEWSTCPEILTTQTVTTTTHESAAGVIRIHESVYTTKSTGEQRKGSTTRHFTAAGSLTGSRTVSASWVEMTLAQWNGEEQAAGEPCMVYAMGNWYAGEIIARAAKRVTVRYAAKNGNVRLKVVAAAAALTPAEYAAKQVEWAAAAAAHKAAR